MKRYAITEVPYYYLYSQALKKYGIAYFFTVKKKKKKETHNLGYLVKIIFSSIFLAGIKFNWSSAYR